MVASDRVSAFDVIMAEPIPDKGRVLTAMTVFLVRARWPTSCPAPCSRPTRPRSSAVLGGRVGAAGVGRAGPSWCERAEMLQLECIVRGYLAGQAYEEYARAGTVHGTAMPAGLQLADQLAEPIFTPSTKASRGPRPQHRLRRRR